LPSKKKKKTRQPNQEKPNDPVQGCPLKQKKVDPKYCYLTALEITKGDKPKRTRWGKEAEKFVVFPATVQEKEESDTSNGFPVFDGSSAPQISIVAVRPNLVDKDNKAMTILAQLREPTKSDKADKDHDVDNHHLLKIDRRDDSALRSAVQSGLDTLVEALNIDKKIKETWKDIEKRRKKLEKGISQIESNPKAAQKSIEDALTFEDDDDDDDDEEDDDNEENDDQEEDDDDDDDDDDANDAEDQEDSPYKLKAEVYPQDPTLSKLFEKVPVVLAKWCPEKYDWAAKVPKITDVLRALWLKNFTPRAYAITSTSCGEAPPDKAAEATQSLRAQILVYPADQFKFILRVPKLAKGSVGYEGRYISKTGEVKSIKTSSVEIKGVTSGDDDEEADGGEEQPATIHVGDDDDTTEGPNAGKDTVEADLYDPDSYKDDDAEEEDDDDDDDGTLLQISEDEWVLPWDDEKDDDDEEDKDDDDEEDDDDEDAEVKKLELKLTREPQPKDGDDDDDDDKEKDDDELDYSESLNAIFNVIQSIREVWDSTKGLSFTLGFSIEASIGFLEGKADWEWGWRESTRLTEAPSKYLSGVDVSEPDRQMPQVVYSQKYSAKLTILSLDLALKLGIDLTYAGIGFRAALVGTVAGKLNYESESIQEYCPVMQDYYKSDPEKWVVSTIKGTLEAKAILLSADTFRATGKIETGYWVRAKRGDDESFQIAYEWRFLGLKMQSEFKIKGYKTVTTAVVLLDETPEDAAHKGTFPTYASKTPFSFRQTLMEYKDHAWDIQQEMQAKMTELRILYFSKFFPKLWPKIQAAAVTKNKPLVWGDYDDYRMDNWLAQIRRIAKTAPKGQIALGIQHTFYRNPFVSRSGYSSWASRSNIWDKELDGMLVPENTDLDIMGKDMGQLLWNLRILGAFYQRFVVFCELLVSYSDEAIALSRAEEQKDSRAEPSEEFKTKFIQVGKAFRDIMYGPRRRDGKKDDTKSGWKDGKFQAAYKRVLDQINGFNMTKIAKDQLVPKWDNARLQKGRIKFKYPLSTTHGGYWTNDELSNANIKWQKKS
jgi:hypothetical protein